MTARTQPEGVERLERLVSPYTGIVHRLHEVMLEPDDSRHARFECELASTRATIGVEEPPPAGGSGATRSRAVGAAIGEALERYAGLHQPPESETRLAAAAEIGPAAVAPERFALFSESQYEQPGFEFVPFTEQTRVRWVEGRSIPDGEPVYLPLQLAHIWRQAELAEGELAIAPGTSNGMATGLARDDAILGGLLELIERDAVMLTWANRLSHPRIEASSDAGMAAVEQARFRPSGVSYEVADLSVFFGVPTALAVSRGGAGRFGVGGSSAASVAEAWEKALRECFQVRTALKRDVLDAPDPSFADPEAVKTFLDHARFYSSPAHQDETRFLTGSPSVSPPETFPRVEGETTGEQLATVAARLQARGVSAYWVDIAPPDLKEAGVHAVSVISPELQPLDASYRHRFLGGRRLRFAAFELGLREQPLSEAELNPLPHPFA
jgi:ribosomal protein S12 methylthiotransferase accessory factor